MITTISAIEFLAAIVLAELNIDSKAEEKKVVKLSYPELKEKAELIEEEFPSIRIDLRRAPLENYQFIKDIDKDKMLIQIDDKTKELMEYYRPSEDLYQLITL